MSTTETPHRTAAQHLARAEALIADIERARANAVNGRQVDLDTTLDTTLAHLHIAAADCMAQLQIAEKHVELADILTAYSIDAGDVEDKDHGPDAWPPVTT